MVFPIHLRVVLSTTSVWSFSPTSRGCSTFGCSLSITSVWFPLPTLMWVFFLPKFQTSYPNLRTHINQSFQSIFTIVLALNPRFYSNKLLPNLACFIREATFSHFSGSSWKLLYNRYMPFVGPVFWPIGFPVFIADWCGRLMPPGVFVGWCSGKWGLFKAGVIRLRGLSLVNCELFSAFLYVLSAY